MFKVRVFKVSTRGIREEQDKVRHSSPRSMQDVCHMNLVQWPRSFHKSPVAQQQSIWTSNYKAIGSTREHSVFFFRTACDTDGKTFFSKLRFLNINEYTIVVLFMRILNSITEEEGIIRVMQFLSVKGYIPYIINVKRYERLDEQCYINYYYCYYYYYYYMDPTQSQRIPKKHTTLTTIKFSDRIV